MAGVVLNPGCRIGRFCVLNTGSILEHDGVLADFAGLAPGTITGGHVALGFCASVNIGAVVADRICIGEHAVVGAGSTVLNNVEPFVLAYGTPAKAVRRRQAGEHYF